MNRKSFVSVVFFSDKIQVLKLASQKDKVEKVFSVALRPEVISNYQVQNTTELTTQLKNLWKKENIAEKSVGIVIPEFSTFTKLLKMPVLEDEELDEAVRWQSQEFLPTQSKDVVLDWEVTNESGTEIEVLVVAVQQSILAGYVQAIGAAGLLPLVVETPSVALVRSTSYVKDTKLIIFLDRNEAILAVANGKAILGSSVIKVTSLNDIVQTASLILTHYEEAQIKSILVTGGGITKEIMTALGGLGRPVEMVNQKLIGLSPNQVQEFIIPIALGLKESTETIDRNTINLLPPDWIKHYKDKLMDIRVWSVTLLVSTILLITFLGVLGTFIVLNSRFSDINAVASNSQLATTKEVTEQVGEANNLIKSVQSVLDNTHSPKTVINSIFAAKPDGINVTSIAVSLTDGAVSVKGIAERSDILFDFRQAFEENKDFTTPSLPIRNITQESNIVFDLQFTYIPASAAKTAVPTLKLN